VLSVREWTPFGVEVGGTETGLGFTGEWQAAYTNLTYLRARWYDSQTGRFTSRDPREGNWLHPSLLQYYLYASNHPVNYLNFAQSNGNVLKRE
jgi:RHS repeat-associated protein